MPSPCKARKVKCDERRPNCLNCERQNSDCNYDRILKWGNEPGPYNSIVPKGKWQPEGDAVNTDLSAPQIGLGHSPVDGSVYQNLSSPLSAGGSLTGLNGTPRPRFPSFKRPDSSSSLSSTGNRQTLTPSSSREPHIPIDPALSEEAAALNSPVVGNSHRYYQSHESYRSSVQDMGVYISNSGPAIPKLRGPVDENSPISSDHNPKSPDVGTFSNRSTSFPILDSPVSTPPFFISPRIDVQGIMDHEKPLERMRMPYEQDASSPFDALLPPSNASTFSPYYPEYSSSSYRNSKSTSNPLSPASYAGDDSYRPHSSRCTHLSQDSPDLRRLSVNSLLSGPPGMPAPRSNPDVRDRSIAHQDPRSDFIHYGIDRGFKDLDIGSNDDLNAISGSSPLISGDNLEHSPGKSGYAEFGFGMETKSSAFASASYYDKPVSIRIPKSYGELPSKLKENPMNILYFHHFINHTAGCLVPHNCLSNPFMSILPKMALQDENLLNLLLAYSALHRARLLRQPEPELRIALWVQDIFPNLRRALDDPNQIITNANLATAIMLASLEIISPKAFGVEVSWHNHLDTARQMIAARGGPQNVQTASRSDKVLSFLWSWFAYLDVLGSLSGVKANSSTLVRDLSLSPNLLETV